jgi:hypothetical protein
MAAMLPRGRDACPACRFALPDLTLSIHQSELVVLARGSAFVSTSDVRRPFSLTQCHLMRYASRVGNPFPMRQTHNYHINSGWLLLGVSKLKLLIKASQAASKAHVTLRIVCEPPLNGLNECKVGTWRLGRRFIFYRGRAPTQ